MSWGRRGKDIPKEDLTAMGLNYGEADRDWERERPPRRRGRSRWFGFSRGSSRGRREVLGGRVSVDSMKLKYEEGWNVEAVSGGELLNSGGLAAVRCWHEDDLPDCNGRHAWIDVKYTTAVRSSQDDEVELEFCFFLMVLRTLQCPRRWLPPFHCVHVARVRSCERSFRMMGGVVESKIPRSW